jgi:hypothetical protein
MNKNKEDFNFHLNIFLDEGTKLINTKDGCAYNAQYGTELRADQGPKNILVRGNNLYYHNCPKGVLFAKIDKQTGEIISRGGWKARSSIYSEFHGTEVLSKWGVLTDDKLIALRVQKLRERKKLVVLFGYVTLIVSEDIAFNIRKILIKFV